MAVRKEKRLVDESPARAPSTDYRESIWILPHPEKPEPFRLDSAGMTLEDPNYRCRRNHWGIYYYVLEYIVSGEGELFIGDHHFHPTAGSVYLLPPGLASDYYNRSDAPWKKIWFNVGGELIDQLVGLYGLIGPVFIPQCPLLNEFQQGLEIVRHGSGRAYTDLAALLLTIFSVMSQYQCNNPATGARYSQEGRLLKAYLDKYWREDVSLKELGEQIGKSPAQTLRIFRNDFNDTPGAYRQKRRLEMAQRYLLKSNYNIKAIADIIGFENEFHFSNWFKLKTGMAPKHYRSRKKPEDTD